MQFFTRKQRFKIAIGGFLSFVGFVILAVTLLVVTKSIDIEVAVPLDLLIGAIAVIGVLDVLGGILLLKS